MNKETIGGLIGALAGGAYGYNSDDNISDDQKTNRAMLYAALGGATGVGMPALYGGITSESAFDRKRALLSAALAATAGSASLALGEDNDGMGIAKALASGILAGGAGYIASPTVDPLLRYDAYKDESDRRQIASDWGAFPALGIGVTAGITTGRKINDILKKHVKSDIPRGKLSKITPAAAGFVTGAAGYAGTMALAHYLNDVINTPDTSVIM
jgi:hypothetical protein